MSKKELPENNKFTNKVGLFLALTFYVVSVIMVAYNTSESTKLGGEVQTITIAHWQLEDGFREGFDEAIKQYEELKAKQGQKVKIIQTTVPYRGYSQWFITQLISGNPADIIELSGDSRLHNQYFRALSSYIAQPNPYNVGTPLAGMPWKDTYIDGMKSSLDRVYAEYFGIGTFFHVLRVYVNKDLLKAATGSSKLPETFDEWMEDCRKLREYGEREEKTIIPIGVRGFDKSTLDSLFKQYFSQLNGNLNDNESLLCESSANNYDILKALANRKLDPNRLLAATDLIKELGQNFNEGFTATDLEQTKFLFFTGNVGFFPEGTWNAWSMVNNSPFEVGVINIPIIGKRNRYYKDFTGRTSEMGVWVGGRFGITKASKNFDLSLDFMRFLTSWKINQMTMMDYCKWPPAVIKAEYKGLLKKFVPIEGDAMLPAAHPFAFGRKSRVKMLEILEQLIISNDPDAKKSFWRNYLKILPFIREELVELDNSLERQFFDIEGQRNSIAMGLETREVSAQKRKKLEYRYSMGLENLAARITQKQQAREALKSLDKLKEKSASIEKELK